MNINLSYSKIKSNSEIIITGSKSETNRLLLLQALFPEISLKNTSNSDDSEVMLKALAEIPKSQISNPNSQISIPKSRFHKSGFNKSGYHKYKS